MTNPTPRPWKADKNSLGEWAIFDSKGQIIAVLWQPEEDIRDIEDDEAIANSITRAVNRDHAFEGLLDAAKEAIEILQLHGASFLNLDEAITEAEKHK
jgi:hypothetical protein